ncbi:MAG TPA: SBBP repeat-containing protein [Pyrinomonadaceae bacterium]|nr:SBBP repeat-containing protein [Pyrinomonadaceae bacterium]
MLFRLPLLKKLIAVSFTLLLASLCWLTLTRTDLRESAPDKVTGPVVNAGYGKLPLQFEPNEGQAAADVAFLTRGSGYTLLLKQTEAVLSLRKTDMRLKLLGSNPAARISALDVLPGKVNHFIGKDQAKWRTNISTYAKVKYEGVYPGVDLVYYGDQGRLEYDFVVAPKTDPQLIQLSFPEAKELRIDQAGDLIVKVQDAELRQPKPLIYQETANGRRIIDGNYILKGRESFAFEIGDYDRNEPLIIDPTLTYSTLLGTDTARSVAADAAGNAYITGQIDSNVYVLKLNPSGTALIYSALIGGAGNEEGSAIALDAGGNAYVTGSTSSTDFPTVNAIQPAIGAGDDAFVFKLTSNGALSYSTYLGGDGFDSGTGIVVNSTGNVYVTGTTGSTNFPVANALQPVEPGSGDVFVSKLNTTGNAFVYSTYVGGSGNDSCVGIALDSEDRVYIAGNTDSTDFPTTNDARQPTAKGSDTFVTKLSSSGTALLYSSYHGGSSTDFATRMTVHSDGSIYITGFTFSTDFPLVNPLQSTPNFTSLFITKFDSSGKSIVYSTYLGGTGFDVPSGLTTDSSGNLYITGKTSSGNFPLAQPLQRSLGGSFATNAFVSKVNPNGSALLFSTYLGSSLGDQGWGIAVRNGSIFITGDTSGARNFPVTSGAFRQNHFEEDNSVEGFALRIDQATNTNYYSISGIVFGSNGPVSGTLVTLSGSTSRRVRTDFNGQYSFHTLVEGGTYTVTPTSQFNFSPASRTFANLNADQPNASFVVQPPPNDNFANAQVISNTSGVISGTNAGATVEPGEALNGSSSVWYRWQATSTGKVMLNYTANPNNVLLEVFTGSSVNNLTNVSTRFADCETLGCLQSAASFRSVVDTVYFIRVAGVPNSGTFGFSFAPGGPTISGIVGNVNGRSLKGFAVRANILGQNKVAVATTSDSGYSLVLPAGGSYSVVALSPFGLFIDSFVTVQVNNLTQDVPNVNFTVSNPTVNIGGSIGVNGNSAGINVTATGVGTIPRPCNLSSSVSFVSFTCPVPIFGDYTIVPSSPNHTFNPTSIALFEVREGTNVVGFGATEIPKEPLQLMIENPNPVQDLVQDLVLAVDATLLVRDPFRVINPLNWLNNGSSDKNTRIAIFLKNFRAIPGEPPSEVVIRLVGNNNNNLLEIPAEDVRPLANSDLVQVTFRLPENILIGFSEIRVRAHGEFSNRATLRISP